MVNALCDRPAHRAASVMVVYPLDVGRENSLIRLVYGNGEVRPPHEHLRQARSVIDFHFRFNVASALVDRNADHTFKTVERLYFARPNGLFAVLALFDDGFEKFFEVFLAGADFHGFVAHHSDNGENRAFFRRGHRAVCHFSARRHGFRKRFCIEFLAAFANDGTNTA